MVSFNIKNAIFAVNLYCTTIRTLDRSFKICNMSSYAH